MMDPTSTSPTNYDESTTYEELDEVGLDNNYNHHDATQLPAVDEYKAQVGFVSQGARRLYMAAKSLDQLPTVDPCQVKRFPQRSRKPGWRQKGYHLPVTLEEYHAQVNYAPRNNHSPSNLQQSEKQQQDPSSLHLFSIRRILLIVSLLVVLVVLIAALSSVLKRTDENPIMSETVISDMADEQKHMTSFATTNFLAQHVLEAGWSEQDDLENPQSPQRLAIGWMSSHDDDLHLLDETSLRERYGAVTLYFAMGGPNWYLEGVQFLQPNVHICAWYQTHKDGQGAFFRMGIDCSCQHTEPKDTTTTACDMRNASVQRIILKNLNLTGMLPREIRLFKNLFEIDVHSNNMDGTFPPGVTELGRLRRLDLSQNKIHGPVPSWIDQMKSIQYLDISSNELDDEVPSTLRNLDTLEFLNAFNNSLVGDIHAFQGMENLKALFVGKNKFSGNVDHDLLKSLPNLQVLDVSENLLTAMFHTLGHPNLVVLDLHGNAIKGEFPDIDPLESKLKYLSLRENSIYGSLPYTISALSDSLYHLDVARNSLSGPMPTALEELVKLEYLDLSFNDWDTGEIPPSYKQLQNLKYLALQDTNREGFLSHELAVHLPQLEILDVGRNNLVGNLPESLSLNPNLRRLVLYHNSFMGNLNLLEEATRLQTLVIHGGNAWDDLDRLGDFCDDYAFPFLETLVARPCTNDAQDVMSPFCPCCKCCPDPKSPECDSIFWFSNTTDTVWDTKYVRNRFRTREATNDP